MNSEDNRMPMSTVLIISAAFAVVFLILFMWVGGFGFLGAFFLGLLVGIVVFVILMFMFAGDSGSGSGAGKSSAHDHGGSAKPAGAATDSSAAAASGTSAKATGSVKASGTTGSDASVAASATTTGAADATKPGSGAAKRAGNAKPKPGAKGASATEAKPKAAKAKPAAPAKPAKAKDTPTKAPVSAAAASGGEDYDKDGVLEGTDEGSKPETLSGPRDGGADNLKEIKGVGPAMEKLLHSLGFYHFDQVAKWTPDEVAWVNSNLGGFKGRATRDDWVAQAKILASGGETAFSKKVDKGGVY